jgi:hypothetical protein
VTDSTDRVLASIDEAIDGYVSWDPDTSPDAMRWRPDKPAEARMGRATGTAATPRPRPDARPPCSPPRAYWAPAGALPGGPEAWTDLGYVADGGFVYGEPRLADHVEAARRLNDQLTVTVRADVDAVMAAFASIGRAIKQMGAAFGEVAKRNHPAVARLQYGDDYRRHRRTCRLCNPAGNPKPLAVNGAEYRRRTRARTRRNRR